MSDCERWEDLGCGDGACVFRTPTGMHTNGGCRCLPRKADYNAVKAALGMAKQAEVNMRWSVSVMRDRIAAQARELAEARRRVEELEGRQEVLLNIARFTDDYLNGRSEAMKPWELREAVRHVLKTMTAEDPAHD